MMVYKNKLTRTGQQCLLHILNPARSIEIQTTNKISLMKKLARTIAKLIITYNRLDIRQPVEKVRIRIRYNDVDILPQ